MRNSLKAPMNADPAQIAADESCSGSMGLANRAGSHEFRASFRIDRRYSAGPYGRSSALSKPYPGARR
jgi:hypothetical protein